MNGIWNIANLMKFAIYSTICTCLLENIAQAVNHVEDLKLPRIYEE